MRMGLDIYQTVAMECSICKYLVFGDNKDIEKTLFGAKKYSVCPSCGQEVNKKDQTKGYKKRYNKFIGE